MKNKPINVKRRALLLQLNGTPFSEIARILEVSLNSYNRWRETDDYAMHVEEIRQHLAKHFLIETPVADVG